jgi:hypothetical protein
MRILLIVLSIFYVVDATLLEGRYVRLTVLTLKEETQGVSVGIHRWINQALS